MFVYSLVMPFMLHGLSFPPLLLLLVNDMTFNSGYWVVGSLYYFEQVMRQSSDGNVVWIMYGV